MVTPFSDCYDVVPTEFEPVQVGPGRSLGVPENRLTARSPRVHVPACSVESGPKSTDDESSELEVACGISTAGNDAEICDRLVLAEFIRGTAETPGYLSA